MRTFIILIFAFTFITMAVQGQTKDKIAPHKNEHKQIKASQHLKKELQKKQLLVLPERINDKKTKQDTFIK